MLNRLAHWIVKRVFVRTAHDIYAEGLKDGINYAANQLGYVAEIQDNRKPESDSTPSLWSGHA